MKKIKYIIIAIFSYFILIGSAMAASVSINYSCPNEVNINTEFTCDLKATITGSLKTFSGTVSVSGGTLVSVSPGGSWQGNSGANIDYYTDSIVGGTNTVAKVKVKSSNQAGKVKLSFNAKKNQFNDEHYGSVTVFTKPFEVNVKAPAPSPSTKPTTKSTATKPTNTTATPKSTTTRAATTTTVTTTVPLAALDFTEIKIDGFNVTKDGNAYYATVNNDTTKINISASVPEGVKITGELGERGLNDGKNVINYVLVEESTNRSIEYQLIVTKPTAASVNTKLRSLKVVDYNLAFNPDTLEYTLKVDNSVKELYVIAEGNNKDVTITGTGLIDLAASANVIKVTSTYGENNTSIYTINIKKVNKSLILYIIIGTLSLILICVVVYFVLKDQGKIEKGIFESLKSKAQSNRNIKKQNANVGVKIGGNAVVGLGSAPVQPTQVVPTGSGVISQPQVQQQVPQQTVQTVTTANSQPSAVRTVNVGQPVRVVTKTTIPTQVQTINAEPVNK